MNRTVPCPTIIHQSLCLSHVSVDPRSLGRVTDPGGLPAVHGHDELLGDAPVQAGVGPGHVGLRHGLGLGLGARLVGVLLAAVSPLPAQPLVGRQRGHLVLLAVLSVVLVVPGARVADGAHHGAHVVRVVRHASGVRRHPRRHEGRAGGRRLRQGVHGLRVVTRRWRLGGEEQQAARGGRARVERAVGHLARQPAAHQALLGAARVEPRHGVQRVRGAARAPLVVER